MKAKIISQTNYENIKHIVEADKNVIIGNKAVTR